MSCTKEIDEYIQEVNQLQQNNHLVKDDESEKLLLLTLQEIEVLQNQLDEVSQNNAIASKETQRCSRELSVLTHSITKNVQATRENIQEIVENNDSLSDEIDVTLKKIQQISDYILLISQSGEDINEIDNFDAESVLELCGLSDDIDLVPNNLFQDAEEIVNSNDYFSNCQNNDEFIERIKTLIAELREYDRQSKLILNNLLSEFQKTQNDLAAKMAESQQIINELEEEKAYWKDQIRKAEKQQQAAKRSKLPIFKTPNPVRQRPTDSFAASQRYYSVISTPK